MAHTAHTAIITGGTKGIGLGVAHVLIQNGIKVCITGRDANTVKNASDHLNSLVDDSAIGVVSDVRDYDSQVKSVDAVIKKWGRLDYFVANAGVGHFANIEQLSFEQWHETIDINLTGVFYSAKACLEELKKTQGFFITIASLAGTNFFAAGSAYNASKFGLVGFTQAMMLDVRDYGVRVSTIMPGSVSTFFNGHVPTDADAWKIQPEDIGQLVMDLIKMPARTLPSKIEVRPSRTK
jgi:NADP-dependent 3-hydroxy acid dehydrogenase YdfG